MKKNLTLKICKDGVCKEYRLPAGYGFDLDEMISFANPDEAKESGATMPSIYISEISVDEN